MASALRLNALLDHQFQPGDRLLCTLRNELKLLDGLCRTLGVAELSQFIDTTALELQAAVAMLGEEGRTAEVPEVDPATGQVWGIEDVSWQPVAAGMSTLEALEQHLRKTPHSGLNSAKVRDLLDELGYCTTLLTPLEAEGAQFHLALEDQG
ncbi:hypothetical protein GCM10007421_01260 [Halopseudomonas oceani]|uniref:Uncharacterized protein n=1 Tax=Halopseudomonas oceani TaxID=1708783 RepID=A0A2P4EWJ2_9GAMM|nr:hypothetical protein [Halopseudomonas oceani]POB04303.1 hypothetical protein C1949_07745 [Halopseudomonas oceani]GGE31260.1 hypothetical protein GCM10007421_01260 [Halopseudomonas oceani]